MIVDPIGAGEARTIFISSSSFFFFSALADLQRGDEAVERVSLCNLYSVLMKAFSWGSRGMIVGSTFLWFVVRDLVKRN